MLPDTARQCDARQSAGSEGQLGCCRTRVQMARFAQAVRQLAYDLYAHESLVRKRGVGSRLCPVTTGTPHPSQDRSRGVGQYRRQSPSGRDGGIKKTGPQALGRSRGGWTTKIHLVATDARTALAVTVSPGQAHDALKGRKLLHRVGSMLLPLAGQLGDVPVVPLKQNRRAPWDYDRGLYARRNEIARLFRRLKGFWRIFSRFDKLDVMVLAFITFALIVEGLHVC